MGRALLIMALGLSVSLVAIKYNLDRRGIPTVGLYTEAYDRVMRRNVKNSAANMALREVLRDLNWRADSLSQDPEVAYDQIFPWRHHSRGLILGVRIEVVDARTDTTLPSMTALRIRAISGYNDIEDTTVVVVDRASFSRYAYFTGYEDQIWFTSNDTIRGPVHTNGILYMRDSPTFYGPVSSAAKGYIKYNSSSDPSFLGGASFGRPAIPMPDADGLEYLKLEAREKDHLYDGELWLTFNANGTYDWVCTRVETTTTTFTHTHIDSGGGVGHTHPDNAGWHRMHPHDPSPDIQLSNGTTNASVSWYQWHRHPGADLGLHSHTLVSTGTVTESGTKILDYETVIATSDPTQDIHVQGTVNGMVTVYSAGHLWIDDDIVYGDDARDGESDDMLGLLAYKSVVVTDNAANNDGDVWVDATIGSMTTERPSEGSSYEKCFHAENYDIRPRGRLHIYGGIVQRERGAVGTSAGWAGGTGMNKDYQYDERFLNQRPPSYPVLKENLIISWQE